MKAPIPNKEFFVSRWLAFVSIVTLIYDLLTKPDPEQEGIEETYEDESSSDDESDGDGDASLKKEEKKTRPKRQPRKREITSINTCSRKKT
eukprot:UN00298